ncbi:MAG: RHS repeat-associated core domain-containing protein [Bacteroidota bacterium]
MIRSLSKILIVLSTLMLAGSTVYGQVSIPDGAKIDLIRGRSHAVTYKELSWPEIHSNLNQQRIVFDECYEDYYWLAFQLSYDVADKNTTTSWDARLKVQIETFEAPSPVWSDTLSIHSSNQNYVSTVFYPNKIECGDEFFFKVTEMFPSSGTAPANNISLKVMLMRDNKIIKITDPAYSDFADFNCGDGVGDCVDAEGMVHLGWDFSWRWGSEDEFEIEWVFIADYEGFSGYNSTAAGNADSAFRFKEPAGITTKGASYDHQIFYPKGKLWYRIRAIGYNDDAPDHRILGLWQNLYDEGIPVENQQLDKTWQAQTLFTEDGKYKKVVTYYDPTLRQRQSQVNLSSTNTTLVSETMYDFEGRPSISMMAVPDVNNALTYRNNFNKFVASGSVASDTSSIRKKVHYDNGLKPNSLVATSSGAGQYYSSSNPISGTTYPWRNYIPNAGGYVYSQTEYERDGKNFVKRQSGIGQDFRMDGGRVTQQHLGQADDVELRRLFGANVGNAAHYKKLLSLDNNGQVSVSYLDQEGRTIATALAGDPPDNVKALQSYDSLSRDTTFVDLMPKNKSNQGKSITVHKILNEVLGTTYSFHYSMSALTLTSLSAKYDLTISITDPDGLPVDLSNVPGNEPTVPLDSIYRRKAMTVPGNHSAPINFSDIDFTVNFTKIGDYTLTKTLTPASISDEDLQAGENSVVEFITELLEDQFPLDETQCENCTQAVSCPDSNDLIEEAIEDIAIESCRSIYEKILKEIGPTGDSTAHPQWCRYQLCRQTRASNVFDMQMARVPNWEAAKTITLDVLSSNDSVYDFRVQDPFFYSELGRTHPIREQMKTLLNTISLNSFLTGRLDQVTDPNNTDYYINDQGEKDADGYHILYYNLMLDKSVTNYKEKLSEAHWTMFRNFYQDAKRRLKMTMSDYQDCDSAMIELERANLPPYESDPDWQTIRNEISDYKDGSWPCQDGETPPCGNGLTDVSDEEINSTIWMLGDKCHATFTEGQITTLKTNLSAYFNSNPLNFMRLFLKSDWDSGNSYLTAIAAVLTAHSCSMGQFIKSMDVTCFDPILIFDDSVNKIQNPTVTQASGCSFHVLNESACFPGWTAANGDPHILFGTSGTNSIYIRADSTCDPAADAARGTFTETLDTDKWYRLCFKYKASPGDRIEHAMIQLSSDGNFYNGGSGGGGGPLARGSGDSDLYADTSCVPRASSPNPVQMLGSTGLTGAVWFQDDYDNSEYVDACVTFKPSVASQYFFISIWTDSTATVAVFSDFHLSEASDILTICGPSELDSGRYKFDIDWDVVRDTCIARAASERKYLIDQLLQQGLENYATGLYRQYNPLGSAIEELDYSYVPQEYHYTLYYYDQAGNLVQTVPPAGVVPLVDFNVESPGYPDHKLLTHYKYNSYNKLELQASPDADTTLFFYDNTMQLRVSRNAQQKLDSKYSYTKYELGRVIETGEVSTSLQIADVPAAIEDPGFPAYGELSLQDVVWISYDDYFGHANRISSVTALQRETSAYNYTIYQYDIQGNVTDVRHWIPGLNDTKWTHYVYDLVVNKPTYVTYQPGYPDQFSHYYEYDPDNRITGVYTSTDAFIWNKDAGYSYYDHGPLARTELGEHRVQGLDYYYTLQGWLKGINIPYQNDFGGDGTGTSVVGKDVVSVALGYFSGDYTPIGSVAINVGTRDAMWSRLTDQYAHGGLYNGNISWMITDLAKQGDLQSDRTKGMQGMLYQYDQLNRLINSRSLTSYSSSSGFGSRSNSTMLAYDENFSYDPNGNLLKLKRMDAGGVLKDEFDYQYYTGTNKLSSLHPIDGSDLVINSGPVTSDDNIYRNITIGGSAYIPSGAKVELKASGNIELDPSFTVPDDADFWPQLLPQGGNYTYDKIGNLIGDAENKVSIEWTSTGKVWRVKKLDDNTVTIFRYDGMGNRIEKTTTKKSGEISSTYYARDAKGNVMAIYKDTLSIEYPIYGSSRIGEYKGIGEAGKSILGLRRYEINNHLGNVLTVISDKVSMSGSAIAATVLSTYDYYPFGSAMEGRTWNDSTLNYRYGFNGKEKDGNSEWGDTEYDYGFRIYNPRIGKFLSIDPITSKFPDQSPYQFAGNGPVSNIDVDGLWPKWFVDLAHVFGFDLALSQEHSEDIEEEARRQAQASHKQGIFRGFRNDLNNTYDKEMMLFNLIPGGSTIPELGDYQVHRKTGNQALAGAGVGIAIELWGGKLLKPLGKYFFKYSEKVSDLVKETYKGFFREGAEPATKEIITITNTGTFDDAMKVVQSMFDDVEKSDWRYRVSPHTGKVDGLVSESDPSLYFRLDFDDAKGAHINWNRGKEKGAVLFDQSVQNVELMINKLTSRAKDGQIKPAR